MKYIENQNIWKTCVDALNKLDLSNIQVCHESCCQSNIISKDDEKKVLAEISALATYSYEGDIETGKISQMKLFQMEQNEQIVGSHIFSRMATHYYLQEKASGKDYSKERILCATLHACLGNCYYFLPKEDVVGRVFELGKKLRIIQEFDFVHTYY